MLRTPADGDEETTQSTGRRHCPQDGESKTREEGDGLRLVKNIETEFLRLSFSIKRMNGNGLGLTGDVSEILVFRLVVRDFFDVTD